MLPLPSVVMVTGLLPFWPLPLNWMESNFGVFVVPMRITLPSVQVITLLASKLALFVLSSAPLMLSVEPNAR